MPLEAIVCATSETQWIGLRENLQESPIFTGKITLVSGKFSPTNQSNHKHTKLSFIKPISMATKPCLSQKITAFSTRVCHTWRQISPIFRQTQAGWLFGTPLKYMKVSWDDGIPKIWKNIKKNVPNHQPDKYPLVMTNIAMV